MHNARDERTPSYAVDAPATEVSAEAPADPPRFGFGHGALLVVIVLMLQGGVVFLATLPYAVVEAVDRMSSGGAPPSRTMDAWDMTWGIGLANLGAFAVAMVFGLRWARQPGGVVLPFARFQTRLLPLLVGLSAGIAVLLSEADNLLRLFAPAPRVLQEMMRTVTGSGWGSVFVLVLVAPLTEELLFRGVIMHGFARRYRLRNAILLQALLFSLMHVNPYQIGPAFVYGLILGWLRHRTGSLGPCIVMHASINGAVAAASALPVEIPGFTVPGSFQPWWLDLAGIVLTAGGLALLWRAQRDRPATPAEPSGAA